MTKIDPSRDEFDAVKGILIICIVLGHTSIANTLIPALKITVYSFHIHCFLLFPFLFPAKPFTASSIKDVLIRYGVPYVIFVTFCSILYHCVTSSNINLFFWFRNLLRGLLTGNGLYLKIACGFGLYWFMPVILVLNLLKNFLYSQKPFVRQLLIGVSCLGHLLLGAMSWRHKQYFPFFGIHIAVFVLPLGLLCGYVFRKYFFILTKMRWLILFLFVLAIATMFRVDSSVCLSHLGVPSYKSPFLLLIHNLIPILAFYTFLLFSNVLAKAPFMALIGSGSLPIYLTHQIFVQAVSKFFSWQPIIPLSLGVQYVVGCLSVLAGVAIPLLLSTLLESRENLKSLIFPCNKADLLRGLRIARS